MILDIYIVTASTNYTKIIEIHLISIHNKNRNYSDSITRNKTNVKIHNQLSTLNHASSVCRGVGDCSWVYYPGI